MAPAHAVTLSLAAAGWALATAATAARTIRGDVPPSRAGAQWWAVAIQAAGIAFAAWTAAKPGRPRAAAVGGLAFASYPCSWRAQETVLGNATTPLGLAYASGWLIAAAGDYLSIVALGVKRPSVAPGRASRAHVAAGALGVALGLAGLIVLAAGAMTLALEAKTISFTLYDIVLQGGAVLFGAAALAPASRVGGWRTHLAAVGLASCATVNIMRTALPPYLDGATGAVRAGAAIASIGNVLAMLALGIVPAADSKATPGARYGGAPVGALALGTAGQLTSLAGFACALVGAVRLATATGGYKTPQSTAGHFLKLAIHVASIVVAAACNPLLRGPVSGGRVIGRSRAALVGVMSAAAAFGAYDLEQLQPNNAFRRAANSPLVYYGLFAIVAGELATMLGLGSARPPLGGAGPGLARVAADADGGGPKAAAPAAAKAGRA
jgi:hypothetical protein